MRRERPEVASLSSATTRHYRLSLSSSDWLSLGESRSALERSQLGLGARWARSLMLSFLCEDSGDRIRSLTFNYDTVLYRCLVKESFMQVG